MVHAAGASCEREVGVVGHAGDDAWVGIGTGNWDYDGRPSWVRLDRVLDVPEDGIRREGAILDRDRFEVIATRLRAEFSWS